MTESTKATPARNGADGGSKRGDSQVTLSAIGDVSVAVAESVGHVASGPRRTHWLPIFGFLLLVYVAGAWAAIYARDSAPWVKAFVLPLPLALIATLAFWRRQAWKFRARDWRFKEQVRQDALNSLAHETANGVNGIRANLAGFEEAESLPSATEHLKQVERSLERIDAALGKATGQPRPQPTADSKAAPCVAEAKAA